MMLPLVFLLVLVADVWLLKNIAGHYDWQVMVVVVLLSTLVGWLFIRHHRKHINWQVLDQWQGQAEQLDEQIQQQLQDSPANIPAEHRELAIAHIQLSAIMPAVLLVLLPGIITDVMGMLVVLHARFMVAHLKTILQTGSEDH